MLANNPSPELPVSPVGVAVRMKTLSSHTMGDADPDPGIATFQRMFVSSSQLIGGVPEFGASSRVRAPPLRPIALAAGLSEHQMRLGKRKGTDHQEHQQAHESHDADHTPALHRG